MTSGEAAIIIEKWKYAAWSHVPFTLLKMIVDGPENQDIFEYTGAGGNTAVAVRVRLTGSKDPRDDYHRFDFYINPEND